MTDPLNELRIHAFLFPTDELSTRQKYRRLRGTLRTWIRKEHQRREEVDAMTTGALAGALGLIAGVNLERGTLTLRGVVGAALPLLLELAGDGGEAGDEAGDEPGDKACDEAGDEACDEACDEAGDEAGDEACDEACDEAGDEACDEAGDEAGDGCPWSKARRIAREADRLTSSIDGLSQTFRGQVGGGLAAATLADAASWVKRAAVMLASVK